MVLLLKVLSLQGQTDSLSIDSLKADTPHTQYKDGHPYRCQIDMYNIKRKSHSMNLMLQEMIKDLKIEQTQK